MSATKNSEYVLILKKIKLSCVFVFVFWTKLYQKQVRSSWTGKPIMKSNTNRLGNFADLIPFFPWQTATYSLRKFFKKIKQNASWTLKSLIIPNGLDLLILLRIFRVFVPLEIFKIHHEYLLNYWNLYINSLSSGQFLFYSKDPTSVACDQRK